MPSKISFGSKSNAGFWKDEPGIIIQTHIGGIYYVYLYRWNKDPWFRENELRFATEKEQLSEDGWKLLQKQVMTPTPKSGSLETQVFKPE